MGSLLANDATSLEDFAHGVRQPPAVSFRPNHQGTKTVRILAMVAIAWVTVAVSATAQTSSGDVLPAVFIGSVQSIALPDRSGAWTLQIISRGGLTGRGAGDIVIVSDGSIRRTTGRGEASLRSEELTSLTERIRATNFSQWHGSLLGTCNDCFATLLVLTLRSEDGAVRTYTAYWDTTTRARIAADVLQIHDLAIGREIVFDNRR